MSTYLFIYFLGVEKRRRCTRKCWDDAFEHRENKRCTWVLSLHPPLCDRHCAFRHRDTRVRQMCVRDSRCWRWKKNFKKKRKRTPAFLKSCEIFNRKPSERQRALSPLWKQQKRCFRSRKKPCVDTGPTLWTFWFQFLDLLLFFTTHQRRICRF